MKITAENLGKRFNREWIFKNLNLTFEKNNTYAIIGPNGSGKSTLLQVLWGQLPPSKGSLKYFQGDKEVNVEDVFKGLSIATPYMELIEEFTLLEMLRFHFRFKEVRHGKSLEEIIEFMQLGNATDKLISNFSSGMRQRLKLALAFFSESELLFLDEPTTNLDKKSVEWYQKNLSENSASRTVFIASNQEQEYPASAIRVDLTAFK